MTVDSPCLRAALVLLLAAASCARPPGGEPRGSDAPAPDAGATAGESGSRDATVPDAMSTAAEIVRASGAPGGICTVIGATDAELPLAIAKHGRFTVHALYMDEARSDEAREAVFARGLYGTVSADVLAGGRLPYASGLVNIVVVDRWPGLAKAGLTPEEVVRVLAPLGTAFLAASAPGAGGEWAEGLAARLRAMGLEDVGVVESNGRWVRARKGWPQDIDEWGHYLHGADGNPVAADRVVGPPRRFQWITEPLWMRSHETDSSVSTLVTARGRLFAIVDEAPISLAGQHPLPDKWSLVARDAFNGVLLWKVPIRRWGWREWKATWWSSRPSDIPLNIQKRLVAAGDRVYVTLAYKAPVTEIDARTGEILRSYAGTEGTNEILHIDGTLVLSVLDSDGDCVKVVTVDAATGETKWATEKTYRGSTTDYIRWKESAGGVKPAKLDPAPNTATDGDVVALIDGGDVVGLDFRTGAERWRTEFPLDDADARAGGMRAKGRLWVGTMIATGGVVLHASPNRLAALDPATGKILWTQPKKYIGHLWYEWKDVFVIGGLAWTWGADLVREQLKAGGGRQSHSLFPATVKGYDLRTGKLVKSVPLGKIFKSHHHHRCYRNKATSRYILASRRGTEFVDLEDGKHTVHNWVRGTCHLGMMPANGLQYAPPHPCQCYIEEKLSGMIALAPALDEAEAVGETAKGEADRLKRGPAFGGATGPQAGQEPGEEDWPAFRHDASRSGAATTRVPDGAERLWARRAGRRASAPIVVGERLFVALVDEHRVACLDATDGATLWTFAAGGRIDSPPTYHRGTVVFGSADGRVYCVQAEDGELVWRFRAAPAERLVGAFGQLESAWPVHGSVLLKDAKAYFAAGRTSQLDGGIRLYALDAATGEEFHRTTLSGPDYAVEGLEENYRLPMGTLPDILASDGDRIYMRSAAFDAELKRCPGGPKLQARGGLADDSYFKRIPWTLEGEYARAITHDGRTACYARMFDTLRGLDPTVYFTPGAKGYLLFAKNVGGKGKTWMERVPVRVRAMVMARDRLFIAGPPDVIDPKDPLGAFEGRKGGLLYAIDSATGKKIAEHALHSPPVFNGAAAANGRLYIAHEDGSVSCFGAR
ncbi:MAG: outer membrane protein assembly factor BamB family protein [Planctomycetota bacterium]|jgi:outer membrane protein assembly factor BamB